MRLAAAAVLLGALMAVPAMRAAEARRAPPPALTSPVENIVELASDAPLEMPAQTPDEACDGPDYEARIAGCTRLLEAGGLEPARAVAVRIARGAALLVESRLDEAIADLDIALRLEPGSARALITRAMAHVRAREPARALTDLDAALTLDLDRPAGVLAMRGHALLALGRPHDAAADFDRALSLEPLSAAAHYGRGRVLGLVSKWRAAIGAYGRALATDHRHEEAYYHRGLAHLALGETRSGLRDFGFALDVRPNFAGALFQRGRANHLLKRYAAAVADYTAVLALDPAFVPALDNRGRAHALLKETEKARADYQAVLRLSPGNGEVADLLARLDGTAGVQPIPVSHTSIPF